MPQRRALLLSSLLLAVLCTSLLAAPSPDQFDGARAFADLQKQCAFGPRVPGTTAHDKTADWLVSQLTPLAAQVTRQHFTAQTHGGSLPMTNILATFNPKGKQHVLLCAHWDTRPIADQDPSYSNRHTPIPGANDGASGVAVLLEIAHALQASPPPDQVTIVLFDGEDYGPGIDQMFLGSRYYAEHFRGTPPDWGVLLDMIGDRDLTIPQEGYSLTAAPEVVSRIWQAAARPTPPPSSPPLGSASWTTTSLLQKGIPCIDVIDFTYPWWHTLQDTPDKCSAASLSQVGRTLLQALDRQYHAL